MAAYRYYGVVATSSWGASNWGVSALEMRVTLGGANLAVTGSGTASATDSVNAGGLPPSNAFDSDAGTYWAGTLSFPNRLQWDFGSGISHELNHFTITLPTSTTNLLKAFTVVGSNDGTTWTTILAGQCPNTAGSSTTFTYVPPEIITVAVSAPMATVAAFGGGTASLAVAATVVGYGGASSSMSCPAPTLFASTGPTAELAAPSPTLYATARSSAGDNDFTYTAPSPTLSAFCGASAKLSAPSASLNITATVVNFGEAALEAPSATLSAVGKVSATGYARLTFGNNLGAYNLVGYGGAVASITLTDSPTIQATGTTGSIGRASLSAPLFELTAEGTAHNYGSALLSAPAGQMGGTARVWLVAPGATLTAIGSAVVTATYEAYAVNLSHRNTDAAVDETTRYTNFPFTHVVRYKNSYFGVNSTGLYLLEGTTDAGTDISYAVKTATSDFDSPNQKTVASAYFSGRIGPDATVTLHAGEGAGVPYAYTTPRGALAQNHRQVFGKGIKQHRYYSLGLSGSDALELDAIELDVKQMNRRI